MWSYGATVCDKTGKEVTINSKETLEAVKFVKALYKEAMDPEVLSWDDAGNNRFLASGSGSWIHNPISAYRTTQKSNPELADKIFLWKTPAGPVRRLAAGAPNSYVIWKFARNQDAAKEFLRYYADHWVEGFKASTGYNHPIFANVVPQPMPILSNDPTLAPGGQAQGPGDRQRLARGLRLSRARRAGPRRGRQLLHHPRHDGERRDRQDDPGRGRGLGREADPGHLQEVDGVSASGPARGSA